MWSLALALAAVASAQVVAQNSGASSFQVGGYLENWHGYSGYEPFNTVYYAFLTLDSAPNAKSPNVKQWDGKALYETMTLAPVEEVMTKTDPLWENPFEWQRSKVAKVMGDCAVAGKKFIWAIGGWSDLTLTIGDDQIPLFTEKVVSLLKLGGDGVDLDWEHLSSGSQQHQQQQRTIVGKTVKALRKALDANGMPEKTISYTTRWNCFWRSSEASDYDALPFDSDGECLDTLKYASADDISWVNLMMYDAAPGTAFKGVMYFTFKQYKAVLELGASIIGKSKLVMGFEPGHQAGEGVWEGFDIDLQVIDYMKEGQYGGIMFWAMNEADSTMNAETPTSASHAWQGNVGNNSQYLAGLASPSMFV
jgi:hypothetical protein